MPLLYPQDHLSTDDVQKTFNSWKYGRVNCHVDYFLNKAGQCHIYSIPYQMERISGVTNSFFGNTFHLVIDLRLFDIRPFEHIYFSWISRALPLLKYLKIKNMTPQENNVQSKSSNNSQNLMNHFPRLIKITLTDAHIDYVDEFLCQTKSYVPRLLSIAVSYENLAIVTNNFTSDLTRVNCAQLKKVSIKGEMAYPNNFYLYFPSLHFSV